MKRTTTLQRVFLGLVALLIVGNATVVLWNVSRLREHQRLVAHTVEVRSTLARIMQLAIEAETGQRGYIITGERAYLEPFTSASSRIHEAIGAFRELTRDNLRQQSNIDELERLVDVRLEALRARLYEFDTRGFEQGAEALRQSGSRQQMIEVRTLVAEMDRLEADLVSGRREQAEASYNLAMYSSAVSALLGLGLVGVALIRLQRDLAFRRQSARMFGEQREWFRTVLASVGDAVIATGTDGRIMFMNSVAESMTGWNREQANGVALERVFQVIDEQTREPVQNPALVSLRDGVVVSMANHTVLISKDGTERSIDDSAAPILLEDGTHVGAVLVFRDVTEKRLTERERVAAFDRELEARHRAEEANRLKDDFLATISHELRTPLNAILGWSAILRSDNAPPEAMSRGLDTIERNARSQAQLIEDLLDASRITQGVLHLNVSTVDPVRVIHAAIDAVQLAADTRGVEISMTLAPDSGQLAGDSQRLQQVIWNLLSNAIKFSPRGSRIDVSLVRLGDVIEIAVADCGRGISAEFLPHVFERFRQADASASRNQGGVGLGLAIVKQLIELHGGSVEATSEGEGKGATFTVRLPVSTTRRESGREATTGPMASPSGVSAEFVPVSLLGLRVAVVEDEADTRDMIEHLLGLCEAEVRTAASASEGLELVRTWRPDLLISDIGMPNRDGFAFIRDVRALPRDQGGAVPAIALTGYAGVEDRVRVLATGFQMHIAKPVEPEEFVAVVASVVGFERQQSMANRDGHGPVD